MQLNWLYLIGSPEYKKLLLGKIQLQPVAVNKKKKRSLQFVYYYMSENSVGSQFNSPNLATHIAFEQNGFKAIAMFFQYLFQFFFMNFYSICGNQDLGQSDPKNSIVALFIPTLMYLFNFLDMRSFTVLIHWAIWRLTSALSKLRGKEDFFWLISPWSMYYYR